MLKLKTKKSSFGGQLTKMVDVGGWDMEDYIKHIGSLELAKPHCLNLSFNHILEVYLFFYS